jgi:hypothetical protein
MNSADLTFLAELWLVLKPFCLACISTKGRISHFMLLSAVIQASFTGLQEAAY